MLRSRQRSRNIRSILLVLLLFRSSEAAADEPEVELTPQEAVRLALEKNLGLQIERLDPALTTAAQDAAAAAFEPVLVGGASAAGSDGSISDRRLDVTSKSIELGLRKQLGTGTTLEGTVFTGSASGGGSRDGLEPSYSSGVELGIRQALLQGVSRTVNEAPLTIARLEQEAAVAALSRKAELIAADTLEAYWDLRAAVAKVSIQEVGLQQSEATLRETEALIAAGKLPDSERASAAYAVQLQRRAKVGAEQALSDVRDRMARLIGLVAPDSLATPRIVPVSSPRRKPPRWELAELQQRALAARGDHKVLQLEAEIRQLDERTAQHGLLPRLDLVAGLRLAGDSGGGGTGSNGSTGGKGLDESDSGYWSSYALERVGWNAGLMLEVPLGNAEARVRRDNAALRRQQIDLSLSRAVQDLSLELNIAWRAVHAAHEELQLTNEAARLAEEKLANETLRYKAGKVTAHILAMVQAEAITERLGREQALATLVKAVVKLQAATGILLDNLRLSSEEEVQP